MQEDLFKDLEIQPASRRAQPLLFPHRFIRVRAAYEDLIFGGLSLLLILLGGFCLGVERGKGLAARVVTPPPMVGATPMATRPAERMPPAAAVSTASIEARRVALPEKSPTKTEAEGRYAIQLASYVDFKVAQTEAQRLSRQGLDAQVLKQGRYFELRLAGYRSREQAAASLNDVRKMYHDSFIKRVSS